jgi:hypothetical protein
MGRLVLLVAVILVSSAAMSNGIRTAGTVAGDGGAPAGPAVVTTQTAVEVRTPPVAVAAAKVSSDHQAPLDDDPDKDSKRKVPNGQDPIHNRYESLIPNHFLILDNKSNLCLRP